MYSPAPHLDCGWHSKTIAARQLLARQVVCPLCKVDPGYFCITLSGRQTDVHVSRTRRAMEGRCRCRTRPMN